VSKEKRCERSALWELRCNAVACSLSFSASGVGSAGAFHQSEANYVIILRSLLSRDQARRLNQKPVAFLSTSPRTLARTTRPRIRKKKKGLIMPTNTHLNDLPPPLDANVTTTTTSTVSPSPYPSNPPTAMTIILSIACGIVATCILLTVRINNSYSSHIPPPTKKSPYTNSWSFYSSAIALRNKHSDKDNNSNSNSIHAMHPLPPTLNAT
jgi:hypothetical protein